MGNFPPGCGVSIFRTPSAPLPVSPSTLPPSRRRDPWLDAVRGVSVVAMVIGHTLDLTLLDRVRELPLVGLYWSFRGLTAPLFLVVAGWALASSLRSARADTVGRRLRRAALVLALGYGLHWPGLSAAQAMAADGTLWPHLLAFDALPCIGWSIGAGVLLLSLLPRTPGRIGALGVLALWIPFVALLLPTLLLWFLDRRRPGPGRCRRCNYDLTGNLSGICPECGAAAESPSAK